MKLQGLQLLLSTVDSVRLKDTIISTLELSQLLEKCSDYAVFQVARIGESIKVEETISSIMSKFGTYYYYSFYDSRWGHISKVIESPRELNGMVDLHILLQPIRPISILAMQRITKEQYKAFRAL